MKPEGLGRRDFLKSATILGGTLLLGGFGYRQIHNAIGRNFQPAKAAVYLA
jgi:hypothetical protein